MNRILIISPNYCFAVLFVRPCRNEMWSFSHWGVCIKTKTMQIWSEASVIWKINCRISCSQIKSCKTSFNSESLNAYAPLSVLNDWMVIYLFVIHSMVLCGGGSCSSGPNQSAFPFCILFWARYFLMHGNWTEKNGKNFRVYFYWIYWYLGRCRRCSQTIWTSIYKTKFLSNVIPSSPRKSALMVNSSKATQVVRRPVRRNSVTQCMPTFFLSLKKVRFLTSHNDNTETEWKN